jgi:hypothetical protein
MDARGHYRWRLIDGNRKIVADSSEGYVSRDGAKRAAMNVKGLTPIAPIVDK